MHTHSPAVGTGSGKVYSLLGAAAILWGAQPVVVKGLLIGLSPLVITVYRYVGITAILFAVMMYTQGRITLPSRRHLAALTVMGVSGIAVNNVLQIMGLEYSTAVNCSLFSATTPALTAALAAVFLWERPTAVQWAGIAISFLGALLLITHGSPAVITTFAFNLGDVLYFFSQLGWAVYTILGRKVMADLSPLATTAWAGLAGLLATGILAWHSSLDMTPAMTGGMVSAIGYMTIGGGVLAMTWWNEGVRNIGPSRAAVFFNVMPLVGLLLAVLLLGERLGWGELLGGAWIMGGLYLTTRSSRKTAEGS